jgi:hypothetical protein
MKQNVKCWPMAHMTLLMNSLHLMTFLVLSSLKTMTVLETCNSSPVCCNRYLLIKKIFDSCQIPDGYRYIDAPYFSYVDEDCCMKSMIILPIGICYCHKLKSIRCLATANRKPLAFCMRHCACKKHKLDAKGPPIGSPLPFVCIDVHVKT